MTRVPPPVAGSGTATKAQGKTFLTVVGTPVGCGLACGLGSEGGGDSLAGGYAVERDVLHESRELLAGAEVGTDLFDVLSGELLQRDGAAAAATQVEHTEVAQGDTIAVEHQFLGAAHELHDDGDDVAAIVLTAVGHHVVGNLVDGKGGATLEEGVGLLGVVLVKRVGHEGYCVINHNSVCVLRVNK